MFFPPLDKNLAPADAEAFLLTVAIFSFLSLPKLINRRSQSGKQQKQDIEMPCYRFFKKKKKSIVRATMQLEVCFEDT